jgi:hypothetical protein
VEHNRILLEENNAVLETRYDLIKSSNACYSVQTPVLDRFEDVLFENGFGSHAAPSNN